MGSNPIRRTKPPYQQNDVSQASHESWDKQICLRLNKLFIPRSKIDERYWDEKSTLRLRMSRDASNVEKYLQFMDDAGIAMAATIRTFALVASSISQSFVSYSVT